MKIRGLKNTEHDFLADMLYEAIFISEGQDPLPKEIIQDKSLSKYVDHWGKDVFDIALVMEVDGQPVGVIWGRLLTHENSGFGYVNDSTPELSMAVKSEHRSQGIGTKLFKAIMQRYREIGVEYLSLSVDRANQAKKLYERLGCVIVDSTETSLTKKVAL